MKQVRSDMVRRSAGLLSAASGEAVRTLLALMKEAAPPPVRLGAAKAVLEIGMKVRELAELEVELRTLEERLDALGPPKTADRVAADVAEAFAARLAFWEGDGR